MTCDADPPTPSPSSTATRSSPLKHAVVAEPAASMAAKQAAHRWATRSWASVHPWGTGRVFSNFADPDLEDWADAYDGGNYPVLPWHTGYAYTR